MAWAFVNGAKNAQISGTSIAVTKSVTAGNLIVTWAGNSGGGGDTPTISDGVNTWTAVATSPLNDGVANNTLGWWWAIAATTASITVTVSNFTSGGVGNGAFLGEWSGNAAAAPNDGGNKKTNTAGSTSTDAELTGSVTTSQNGDLVLSVIYNNNNIRAVTWQAAGTGFTLRPTLSNDPGGAVNITWAVEEIVQGTAGAINPTWTAASTDTYIGMTAAFKVAAAGGDPNRIRFPSQQSAMGVGGMLGGNRLNYASH